MSSSSSESDDMPVTAEASEKDCDSGIENNDYDDGDGDVDEVDDVDDADKDKDGGREEAENEQGDDDSSQEIKSEGQDEDSRSGSSTPEKSESSLPADIHDMKGTLSDKKPPCDVQRVYDEAHNGGESYLSNSDPLGAHSTISLSEQKKVVGAETLMSNGSSKKDSNVVLNTGDDTKLMDIKEGENLKLSVSSLPTSQKRPRSLSTGADFEDRSKHHAIVCDFFARGWCIKGSSCRFLHQRDGTGKRDVPVANRKNELDMDAGLRQDMDASKFSSFPEPLASSVADSSSAKCQIPSERFLPRKHGENLRWHQFPEEQRFSSFHRGSPSPGILQEAGGSTSLPHRDLQKFSSTGDDLGLVSSFGDVTRENMGQSLHTDEFKHASPVVQGDFCKFDTRGRVWRSNCSDTEEFVGGSPLVRGRSVPDGRFISTASIISSSMCRGSSNPSVYDHTSSVFSSSTPFSSISISPSRHTDCPGGSFSFKGLDGDREYHASHSASWPRNSSSPFYSRSEADRLPLPGVPKDLSTSAGHKLQFSSSDWEPSVPFRPSFFFDPASLSFSGSQFDPRLDTIEPPSGGHKSFEVSSLSHGVGIQHMSYQQTSHDPGLTWLHGPEYNADEHSLSFNRQSHGSVEEKNIHSHGLHIAADETTGTFVADDQTKVSTPREGNNEGPGHGIVVDVANTKEISHDPNPRYQTDARHKNESQPGSGKFINEMDLPQNPRQKQHVDAQSKESKAFKIFHARLIEFVKELLKPYWLEGHLSKDAHKTIVKKAVDKVMGTLQPHQIPSTTEAINQYLSFSRSKISKLVEGYVDKYAKSSAAASG
ncbi:protein FRIGIDA-ESSENTIAL 1-like [Macadamia integrifolia]|uniref:protein FRIGIDA-ESSENTIAL 1-like n=1 Tax=Macadamia integrifolia TaxID=60698 RepID=UPI001C52F9AE|nr:protein FRIGIDA-ESSENTIAL 1-like [Macadamia integrifolia]